ncbi:hypothetical protein ACFQ0T_24630 [Kitasatospora gansuensis]
MSGAPPAFPVVRLFRADALAGVLRASARRARETRRYGPRRAAGTGTSETEPETGRPAGPTHAAPDRRPGAWRWPAVLTACYLAQVLFRWILARDQSFPSVNADEGTYLVLSRVLVYHSPTEIPVGSVIPGGYPLLIAPMLW